MRAILTVLAVAALGAAEADPLTVACADGAVLVQHFEASPLGRVWADPALDPLRARAARAIGDAAKGIGTDPLVLARAVKGLQLRVLGREGRRVRWGVQADLGTTATLLRTWLGHAAAAVKLAPGHADEAWRIDDLVVARLGSLVAAGGDLADLPLEPVRADADVSLRCDPESLLALAAADADRRDAPLAAALATIVRRIGRIAFRADLGRDGVVWEARCAADPAGWRPVDRTLLARMPAQAMAVAAVGIDGPALWKAWHADVLAVADAGMHREGLLGAAATVAEVDARLRETGIGDGIEALVGGLAGTVLFAQTPGTPLPGFTLAVPRSPAIDRLVAVLCARVGVPQPADGQPAFLPLGRDVPFQVMLTGDAGHWLATTDAGLAMTWSGGAAGGFADTAMAKELLAAAPAGACAVAATDSAALVRMCCGPANTLLGLQRDWSPAERQAAMAGLFKLAQVIRPGLQWTVAGTDGLVVSGRGDELTTLAAPAIIAAIAIPNLLESRVSANEAATAATIKSGIFAAQVQFQGGGYCDQDGDNVGEYGLLSELSGRRATGRIEAGHLKLLQGPLAKGDAANGYRYALYLPDGRGGAIGEPVKEGARPSIVDGKDVKDADEQERTWVVYAWPAAEGSGRRMFAMGADGQLRSKPWDGNEPAWNDLFGAGGWGGEPLWPVYSR